MVPQPYDLNDVHHETHDRFYHLIAVVMELRFLGHGQQVLGPQFGLLGHQYQGQDSKGSAHTIGRAAKTVLKPVGRGADGRTCADEGGAHGGKNEVHGHLTAACKVIFSFGFAFTADNAYHNHQTHIKHESNNEECCMGLC